MPKYSRSITLITLIIGGLADGIDGFYYGLTFGAETNNAMAAFSNSQDLINEIRQITKILQNIQENKIEDASKQLELNLDYYLSNLGTYSQKNTKTFIKCDQEIVETMSAARAYRSKQPSQIKEPLIKKSSIDDALRICSNTP